MKELSAMCGAKWAIRHAIKRAWKMCGVAGALWLTGCCCLKSPAPAARVDNVYRAAAKVQAKRVAVLPISVWPDDWQAAEGAVALEAVLRSALGKKQRFEIAGVTADELRAWTGRPTWRADEMLPHDLFEKLQLETGCDAVLFTHLGAYQPYEPIVMGWTMKLVEAQTSAILWAVDEVFDGAERPAKAECVGRALGLASVESTPQTMLLSPRGFGEYTFSALLATLPDISQ